MLTKEDAKRVMIARVREWDRNISCGAWYDDAAINNADAFVEHPARYVPANPEAGLDHG